MEPGEPGIDISPEPPVSPSTLRFLKILVTSLTLTMMIGIAVLIGLIVWRTSESHSAPLPERVVLPDGAVPTAFTRGPDWLAVVTQDGRILILDPDGKHVRQEIEIEGAP